MKSLCVVEGGAIKTKWFHLLCLWTSSTLLSSMSWLLTTSLQPTYIMVFFPEHASTSFLSQTRN